MNRLPDPADIEGMQSSRYRLFARWVRVAAAFTMLSGLLVLGSATYEVRPGDTLSEIARDANVDLDALATLNGIDDAHHVVVGQILRLDPLATPDGVHIVAEGEYLSTIAVRYGVTTTALATANDVASPDLLSVGQSLTIPAPSASSSDSVDLAFDRPVQRPVARPGFHIVQPGEALSVIARRYGMAIAELADRNSVTHPDRLLVGQRLVVGSAGQRKVTVSAGQTLSGIAADHLTSVTAIVEANQLNDISVIHPGDVLVVPLPVVSDTAQSVACEASWYGDFFAGRPTASGEIFDTGLMTAASHFVPMHTWVDVTRPDTGGSIRVKINDRGPYHLVDGIWHPHPDRCIDLAEAAAETLGSKEAGHMPVIVTFPPGVPEVDRLQALYGTPD